MLQATTRYQTKKGRGSGLSQLHFLDYFTVINFPVVQLDSTPLFLVLMFIS